MKQIPLYKFHKHKYGTELLIDVLDLEYIKAGIHHTPVHRETFYCIILITNGSEEVVVNGNKRIVQTGDIICSRPREVWNWHSDSRLEGLVLIFEEPFLLSFFNDPHFLDRFSYLQADRPSPFLLPDTDLQERLHHLFSSMKVEIDDPWNKDQHILRAMLYETLMLLNRVEKTAIPETFINKGTISRYVDAFVKLADMEYTTQHEVEYYADKLCITPNYLNKIVRQYFGTTTKQYLTVKIIGEAKRLLTYTSLTIAEIADRLHFETASYFIRFFRKAVGSTPNQFRKHTDS